MQQSRGNFKGILLKDEYKFVTDSYRMTTSSFKSHTFLCITCANLLLEVNQGLFLSNERIETASRNLRDNRVLVTIKKEVMEICSRKGAAKLRKANLVRVLNYAYTGGLPCIMVLVGASIRTRNFLLSHISFSLRSFQISSLVYVKRSHY